jgi:hypothetical protein
MAPFRVAVPSDAVGFGKSGHFDEDIYSSGGRSDFAASIDTADAMEEDEVAIPKVYT